MGIVFRSITSVAVAWSMHRKDEDILFLFSLLRSCLIPKFGHQMRCFPRLSKAEMLEFWSEITDDWLCVCGLWACSRVLRFMASKGSKCLCLAWEHSRAKYEKSCIIKHFFLLLYCGSFTSRDPQKSAKISANISLSHKAKVSALLSTPTNENTEHLSRSQMS